MVRLSVDVLNEAYQFVNTVKQREICFRSLQIPTLENLGVTKDQFDVVDLTDNNIRKLHNLPLLKRLQTLLLHNNHISEIDKAIGEHLPNLKTLALTNNEVTELVDVDPLATCKNLEHLTMVGNPVTHKPNYRLYMIYTLRNVRVLDFQRVKDKERVAAKKLFKPKKTIINDSGTENLTSTDSAAKQLPNTEDPALKMLSNTGGQAMEVSINDEKQIGGSATVVSAAAQMDEYEDMVC